MYFSALYIFCATNSVYYEFIYHRLYVCTYIRVHTYVYTNTRERLSKYIRYLKRFVRTKRYRNCFRNMQRFPRVMANQLPRDEFWPFCSGVYHRVRSEWPAAKPHLQRGAHPISGVHASEVTASKLSADDGQVSRPSKCAYVRRICGCDRGSDLRVEFAFTGGIVTCRPAHVRRNRRRRRVLPHDDFLKRSFVTFFIV